MSTTTPSTFPGGPSPAASSSDRAAPHAATAPVPPTMPAVFYENYGPADVLRFGTVATPRCRGGHVLIRVAAAGINPVDWRMRRGEMRMILPGKFPRVPGFDVAGLVHQGGESLGLTPGTRVLAFLDSMYGGGYAEWAQCSMHCAVAIPDSMTFEEAAAMPLAGSTALQALREHGHLKSGDRVLINGASGGVGGFAVQIAKAYGAHVTAVAGGSHAEYVRSLGADAFFDYHTTDFTQSAQRWNLVFDVAGKSSFLKAKKVLEPKGRFVTTEPDVSGIITSVLTLATAQRGRAMLARCRREDLRELVRLYESGKLKVTIEDVFPLAEAAEAHRRSEQHHTQGKLVLRI